MLQQNGAEEDFAINLHVYITTHNDNMDVQFSFILFLIFYIAPAEQKQTKS